MENMYDIIASLCRDKSNTSISKMCKDTGVSRGTITDLKMKRTRSLSVETTSKIAAYFDVTVDYLLGKTETKKPLVNNDEELNEYLEELKTRPEMKMLFNLAKGATKSDVEKAVKIIEAFLKKD